MCAAPPHYNPNKPGSHYIIQSQPRCVGRPAFCVGMSLWVVRMSVMYRHPIYSNRSDSCKSSVTAEVAVVIVVSPHFHNSVYMCVYVCVSVFAGVCFCVLERAPDRQAGRQTSRWVGEQQAGRRTGRQTGRQSE